MHAHRATEENKHEFAGDHSVARCSLDSATAADGRSPLPPDRSKTREEALLWLNDRLGRMAQLSVMVGPDSAYPASAATTVAFVTGRLEHWTGAIPVEVWPEVERETVDHSGVYKIGSGGVDIPLEARASATTDTGAVIDVLYLALDSGTAAYVLVADDDHPIFGRTG